MIYRQLCLVSPLTEKRRIRKNVRSVFDGGTVRFHKQRATRSTTIGDKTMITRIKLRTRNVAVSLVTAILATGLAVPAAQATETRSPQTVAAVAHATRAAGPIQQSIFYLVTPHRLCLWVKKLVSGSQIIEVPCRLQYQWAEDVWSWGRELLPAPPHNTSLAMGDVSGQLHLVAANNRKAVSTFGYGTFTYGGVTWTIIRFAHQPEFLAEHGRSTVVTLIRRPSVPWSGLYFLPIGGQLT